MSSISAQTFVYPFFYREGRRIWLTDVDNRKNVTTGQLVLFPKMDDDQAFAKKFKYEFFLTIRRRFREEGLPPQYGDLRASLSPTGEEIDSGVSSQSAPDEDGRVVMSFRGLLARPGRDVQHGKVWYVKFPGQEINSFRGESPEDVVNKVYERGEKFVALAEKAPAEPPEPNKVQQQQASGPRVRPGSFR